MFQISDLCDITDAYLETDQVKDIYRAYLFGADAHDGQRRASGEPYIYHPLQVARTLAEMRLDHRSLIAAILHDVVEDTKTTKEHVATEFGGEVAELVDGVTKLSQLEFDSRAEAQAENYQKMLLAMAKDIRVMLVKLADRLHNMRTLDALSPEKRRRVARETLEIYAPIANRLGLNNIKIELEDLGFKALYPMRHRLLTAELKRARGHRKQVIKRISTAIKRRLRQEDLTGEVAGREKHLYSLYSKMVEKRLSFTDVLDVYAFRIIVDSVDMCYRVLGSIHNLYKPLPGRFKDYIAIPKANGYQSLHTVLFGPYGVPIEVQVRTAEMHEVAEAGIAAHWEYKDGEAGDSVAHKRARIWLKELLEMQQTAGNSIEFIEHVKVDLFPDEVYVFTPAGEIMELARGATAVDFAYAVHTDVGNHCVAVKIDRRYAPLRTQLSTGQTVEVITAPWGRPNPAWLSFVATGRARANIRNYLKRLQQGEAADLGRRLLSQSLETESKTIDDISSERIDTLLAEFELEDLDALHREIGLGNRAAPLVTRHLLADLETEEGKEGNGKSTSAPLFIKGSEGMVVSFGRCCRPIPGDDIIGHLSSGRGIVVHTQSCNNLADFNSRPNNWIDVDWEADVDRVFQIDVRVQVENQKGVLATVAAAISEMDVNIDYVNIDDRDGLYSALNFTIEVRDRTHLADIFRRVRRIPLVQKVSRQAN